jgi:hypothetical protein
MHFLLFSMLVVDGLICLTCGVLEANYLQGKSDDCQLFVDTCSTSHRRLSLAEEDDDRSTLDNTDSWLTQLGFHSKVVNDGSRLLSGTTDGTTHSTTSSSTHSSTATHAVDPLCTGHPHFGNHSLHDAEKILTYISIGILVFFFIEQIFLIVELRSEYCKPMFLLDFFVIVSSLAIEIIVSNFSVGGLLVLARTWRFGRIAHGVFESHEHVEELMENDSSIESMQQEWDKLEEARWKELRHSLSAQELQGQLSAKELEIAKELTTNPAVALRCLAFAQAYKKLADEKKERKMRSHTKKGTIGTSSTATASV